MGCDQAVAVIGAGASGLLTAIHLLKKSGDNGPRIYLIEKHEVFGSGAAYSTSDPSHLLNTRAGNMSAFPDDPGHFLRWVQQHHPHLCALSPACFVSRKIYGNYLRALLRDISMCTGAAGRFYLVPDEAVSLKPDGTGRFVLRLAMGKDITADAIVLAMGNPAPHPPNVDDEGVLATRRYIGDPWTANALQAVDPDKPVLLLGTGLTMVDVTISLTRNGHSGNIIALSRRGLLPRRHGNPAKLPLPPLPKFSAKIVADLGALRQHVKTQAERGRDWRDVIDALRPMTTSYWRSLPITEQQRFMRHLRPWWDVHRHRLAPEIADTFDVLIASQAVKVLRGRIKRLHLGIDGCPGSIYVDWLPRGQIEPERLPVGYIINCMGPGNNPLLSTLPVVRQMLSDGLLKPDALGFGLAVDSKCRLISTGGRLNPALFALGPATRGTFWEVTAVPDIRVQAEDVAQNVLLSLQQNSHASEARVVQSAVISP